MIKSLRNKLLLINIIIISALLFISFTVIFMVSKSSVDRDIAEAVAEAEMFMNPTGAHNNGGEHRDRPEDGQSAEADSQAEGEQSGEPPAEGGQNGEPPAGERELNSVGEPVRDRGPNSEQIGGGAQPGEDPSRKPDDNQGSKPDFSPVFIASLNDDGSVSDIRALVSIDETFAASAVTAAVKKGENEGTIKLDGSFWQFKRVESRIAFIEITERVETLVNLFMTLIAVGICALVLIFFLSLFFANRAIRPVEEAWEQQHRFVADASHELKTPLTTINTNIDVLLSHGENTINSESKWVMYIKNEAERMSRLTNELLSLAKMDADAEADVLMPVDFSEMCERSLLTMEAVFFENHLSADSEIEEGVSLTADPVKLEQLIMILLDNASKYTPSGGRILLKLQRVNKNACLSVENTGAGISPEDCRHIFERFYRTDKSRARESGGHGLGLSIAQSICEYHGGRIFVQSEEGEYTRFTVELPIKRTSKKN